MRKGSRAVATRDEDHFERIRLAADIERARNLIERYDDGQAFYQNLIENSKYKIGRLDERLGDTA
jgi:hypothetical protein